MTPQQKQLNMLGLAQRSGNLVSGDELVEKAVKNGRVRLVVIGNDASDATKRRYTFLCEQHKIPLVDNFSSVEMSHALGKSRTICGITNNGMIKSFLSYLS